ncbi:DUF262 domain-containing protein [Flavobacterium fluviatile]|uniref:DUF262 domain-containing protein n=1 Tax=Flavobacterium fluviatile TaxID=1862387 RepID=UPI0013D5A62B|nr:DUF262 domain-containing protein [Flavobacterium fluviatile]
MQSKFQTSIESLATLDGFDFSIPTYQRPYVWGDEQLKKLLDDFYTSFKQSDTSIYYMSTFLTKEENQHTELIDGQQRFTTLWLISFVISHLCPSSSISKFLKKENNLRLGFEIRKEVSEFLEALLTDSSVVNKVYSEDYIVKYPYLKNIARALVFIKGYLEQKPDEEIEAFGDFIYHNVKLIKNTTAIGTDLNQLFSTINSAGIQLEQTDIIKANLLNLIDEKVLFSRIWETCEEMNNFFERNARSSFPASNWNSINLNNYIAFDKNLFKYDNNSKEEDRTVLFTIDSLVINSLEQYNQPSKIVVDENNRKSEEVFCRSIISFGQLLLHTYRIHLKRENLPDFEVTFHVNKLITVFKKMEERNNPDEIKRFFHLLWDVRYVFDKYIIKWISDVDTKSESLELMNFNRNLDSYYSRSKYEKSASLMLQSVLYYTGDYLRQYWLTSYLNYLIEKHQNLNANSKEHLQYLELLDNIFSTTENVKDKELSWKLMSENYYELGHIDIKVYLEQSLGTKFKHYWFQKLEYILWKNWEFEKTKEFESFRVMSRNSVEHIYPQNPEEGSKTPKLEDKNILDSFGNLVLLSVAQNSEYSRKSFTEKKGMFFNKGGAYDTLKSYYIFNNDNWNATRIEEHKNKMIEKIIKHYEKSN